MRDVEPTADVNDTPVTAAIVLGVPNDDIASCAIAVIPKPPISGLRWWYVDKSQPAGVL